MQSEEFNQFLPLFLLIYLYCFKDIQMETIIQITVKEKNKAHLQASLYSFLNHHENLFHYGV